MVVLSKTRKFQYAHSSKLVSLPCSSCVDIIDTSLQPFTVFIKLTLADMKSVITMLILSKHAIEFISEFPCLLGHHVLKIS